MLEGSNSIDFGQIWSAAGLLMLKIVLLIILLSSTITLTIRVGLLFLENFKVKPTHSNLQS